MQDTKRTFTRQEIERALDTNTIWARMSSGVCWRVKRNGVTKTWKSMPGEYQIPIKIGFRSHGYIRPSTANSDNFKIEERV